MDFSVNTASPTYTITAIVSVYNAERFLRGCLEDLVAQTIFAQTQVIIIDAHSPQNEQAIAQEFTEKYTNISYYRTAERETLYASWNRALSMAQGRYITNANADDRHAPYAFERLTSVLDAHPQAALAYANCRVTSQENAHFFTAPILEYMQWLPYDHINLLRRCEIGPQPVWRRDVHQELGGFNADFTIAGDYDMWLRVSERYPFVHVAEELGLYLRYDNNLEMQDPTRTHQESVQVQRQALQRFMDISFVPHSPLLEQLAVHTYKLQRYVCNLERGAMIRNLNKLAYHIYAYLLLSAKLQKISIERMQHHLIYMPNTASVNYLKEILS